MAEEKKKLTYEELEAYTNQTVSQAQRVYKENQELVQKIKNLRNQMNYAEINLAFKALEFRDLFSDDFIRKVVERLELVLTPVEKSQEEEEKEE
jgi:hypothetical protein